jgi:hypothetical protein
MFAVTLDGRITGLWIYDARYHVFWIVYVVTMTVLSLAILFISNCVLGGRIQM